MFNGADLHGKAPSGRELAPQATEGECVTVKRFLLHRPVGSFRHATRATSLAEGGYRKVQLHDKSKFESAHKKRHKRYSALVSFQITYQQN